MKEADLMEYMKKYYPDLEKSPNLTDRFDCISHQHKKYIELKCRNKHYDDLLLEKKKYDFLVSRAGELEYTPLYINYTPNGIWEFDLNNLPNKNWESKWLPKTTEFGGGNEYKDVIFIHTNYGVKR